MKENFRSRPHPDGGATVEWGDDAVDRQRATVRRMFDGVSRRYDFLNRLLSLGLDRRWRAAAIRAMQVEPGGAILDVACGTGDLAFEGAQTVPGGTVTGVDFSRPMLDGAKRKAVGAGGAPVRLIVGDAERLPFGADMFSAAGIAFGIRNVPDRDAALREMARTVRPGGKVVILEFTPSGEGVVDRLLSFYLRHVLPRIGGFLSSRDAYGYLTASIGSFPSAEAFAGEMERAGLEEVAWRRLRPAPTWVFVGTVPASLR